MVVRVLKLVDCQKAGTHQFPTCKIVAKLSRVFT